MEDMTKIDPIMFQPFGAGPRNCIGLRFAITEMKVAMFQLLKEFDFDVCHDTPVSMEWSYFQGNGTLLDEQYTRTDNFVN